MWAQGLAASPRGLLGPAGLVAVSIAPFARWLLGAAALVAVSIAAFARGLFGAAANVTVLVAPFARSLPGAPRVGVVLGVLAWSLPRAARVGVLVGPIAPRNRDADGLEPRADGVLRRVGKHTGRRRSDTAGEQHARTDRRGHHGLRGDEA